MTDPRDDLPHAPPPRLIDSDAALAEALREYGARTRFAFGETRAWQALQVRRGRAKRNGPLLGLSLVTIAALAFAFWTTRTLPPTSIVAETPRARQVSESPAAPSGRADTGQVRRPASDLADTPPSRKKPAPLSSLTPSALGKSEPNTARARESAPIDGSTRDTPQAVQSALGEPSPVPSSTPSAHAESHPDPCIAEQRAGRYESALRCFQNVAAGNGVGAELALYEQARLESAVLGRPEMALRTLGEHLRRFPIGALASEAQLMKLGLLAQTGDERALAEVERALGSGLGSERRGDLLLLRGNILKTHHRCAEALQSYDQAALAGISQLRVERAARACRDRP